MIGLMNLRNIDLALARCQHIHGQFPHSLTCSEGQHKALSKQVLHLVWASGVLVGENEDEEGECGEREQDVQNVEGKNDMACL